MSLLKDLPLRICDSYGYGHYGASRNGRVHNGQDFCCYPDTVITSHVNGMVMKIGYPYADDPNYRYVQVNDAYGNRHRLFYINTSLKLGDMVYEGKTTIGTAQAIYYRYPTTTRHKTGMMNHIHYEVMHPLNDEFFDPMTFINKESL